jgi:antitoxin CptB
MNAGEDSADLSRLRWRCRRGMRELDQLMLRYLDQAWPTASATERRQFEDLLATEDDQLWRWFMGRDPLPQGPSGQLIVRIQQLPH